MNENDLQTAILDLLNRRRPGASICPSEVARGTGREDWRDLMPAVRGAAAALAQDERLVVTQNGEVLSPLGDWRGPVRLQLQSPSSE